MSVACVSGCFLVVAFVSWGTPAFAGVIELRPHKAIYDLGLRGPGEDSGPAATVGRVAIELTGSRCAGYTTTTRFVTGIESEDGDRVVTDARSETYEGPDGVFEFDYQTYEDEELVDRTVGVARRGPDAITIELSEPAEKQFTVARDVVFPTEQVVRTLEMAREGRKFVALDVYDGQNGGETVYATATVVGPQVRDSGHEEEVQELAGFDSWPLTISYFPEDARADDRPTYVVSVVTYENGIGRSMAIDYGSFGFAGTLSHLELLPAADCPTSDAPRAN